MSSFASRRDTKLFSPRWMSSSGFLFDRNDVFVVWTTRAFFFRELMRADIRSWHFLLKRTRTLKTFSSPSRFTGRPLEVTENGDRGMMSSLLLLLILHESTIPVMVMPRKSETIKDGCSDSNKCNCK